MKNLLITLVLAVISLVVHAQDNPYLSAGRSFVGGGLSFDVNGNNPDDGDPLTNDENTRWSASVSPTYGKFYNDRWMVGVSLTVSYQNYRQTNTGEGTFRENLTQNVGIGITPFLRRYFPITERFGAYLQPEVSYTYWRGTTQFERRDDNQPAANAFSSNINWRHVSSLGVQSGLYYFITSHFSVETSLLRAGFTFSSNITKQIANDNVVDSVTKSSDLNVRLNLANQLSLDRILVLNYYF